MTVPEELCCPISLEPMDDPVQGDSPCRCVFSRSSFVQWMERGRGVCPGCRTSLRSFQVQPSFQKSGCPIHSYVASQETCRRCLTNDLLSPKDGLQIVLQTLRAHPDHVQVQQQGGQALARLFPSITFHDENKSHRPNQVAVVGGLVKVVLLAAVLGWLDWI